MFSLTFFGFSATSNPEIKASPDVGFSKVVRIIIVVLFPAPLGPKKPKISPFLTENEISFTAITSPKDLVRDLVSMEYNTLIAFFNYKLLSIIQSILIKNLKTKLRIQDMKGLCQKCHSSNVEITIQDGTPICEVCSKKSE